MRASIILTGGLLIAAILSTACASPQRDPQPAVQPSPTQVSLDKLLELPTDFTPDYKVIETRDVSTATAVRKVVNITVPAGLERPRLEANLKHAAKITYEQQMKPDAVLVNAYKAGDDLNGPYTVAHCTFAPFGDWGRADKAKNVMLAQYRAVVEFRDSYFAGSKTARSQQ